MKKITLLFTLLTSTLAFSQIGISEDFDGGTPTGWTDSYANTTSAACAGSSERDNIWSSSTTGNLTSPNQVGLSNGTDLSVSFDYKILEYSFGTPTTPQGTGWGTAELQYSTDDGTNWTTVLTIDDSNHVTSADCATMMVTIPAASLPNGSDFKIQISNTWGAGDYYFYVDNFNANQVASSPPNCDAVLSTPTNGATDVDVQSDITWTSATGIPTGYFVSVGTTPGGTEIVNNFDNGNSSTYALATLMFSTTYYVTITPYNANGNATGCTEESFTTIAPPPPGQICALPITINVESDCATATPTTLEYASAFDLGTTDLSCDTFGTNTGSWYEFVAPATGSVFVNLTGETAEYAVFNGCGVQVVCNSTATNQGEVTGLTSGTTYQLAVWKDSATSGTTDICIETITCLNPSTLTVAAITTTTAALGWTENGTATAWNVEIVNVTGGGMATGVATDTGVMNPFNATGLMPSTEYQFYVQADCGGGDTSDWIGPISFTTACVAFTPDYEADMSANVPACWEEANNGDAASGPMDLGSGLWFASNHNGTPSNVINMWQASRSDWIISPEFDLSAAAPSELKVYVALTEGTSSGSGADFGSDDKVSLLMTTDGGTTWAPLQEWTQGTVPTDVGEEITYDLSAQTGTVQFAFLGDEGEVDDVEDVYFHVSKFQVRETPSCAEPSTLMVSSIGETSADIGWTENNGSMAWEIVVQAAGTGEPAGAGTAIATNPYSATALMPSTDYEVYVRTDCGAGTFSIWTGPINFTTLTPPPANNDCSAAIALTPGGVFATNPLVGTNVGATDSGELAPGCASYSGGDVWYSAVVPGDGVLTLEVNTETGGISDTGGAVYSGTCGALVLVDCNDDGSANGAHPIINVNDPALANQTVYFRVWEYSNNAVGEFQVSAYAASLSVESAEVRGFTHYVDTANNNFVVNAQSNIQSIEVYNLVGQVVTIAKPNNTSGVANLGSVRNGVYFAKVTLRNGKSSTVKFMK